MPLREDRVRALLMSKGYSNRHVATLIGVNENTVGRWASGKRQPGSLSLNQLAAVLDTSTDYLLGTTEDPTPPPSELGELTDMEQRLVWAYRRGGRKNITRLFGDDDE